MVKRIVRFKVQGIFPFPIDMLRYDSCYPDSEIDSGLIQQTLQTVGAGPVTVGLVLSGQGPAVPTEGRWESFGWKVIPAGSVRS